ncbi:sulfatase-like hydrolase/transferase, partial [Rhizobium leguminosarum]|uniref:sulfatase-like hydrolase/transferase n=1 Tax=Rhizobium leguminosarum TaxID=384 RepID=UPI003F97DCB0
ECSGCNLLLISLDTLRGDRLGFLGSQDGLTPNFDTIAAESVVFANAFTNAFYTTPSHMTVFTSLYPGTHQVQGEDIRLMRNP